MTNSNSGNRVKPHLCRRSLLATGLLVIAGVVAGGYFLFSPDKKEAPLVPPDPKGEYLEPAVLFSIKAMRERVLKDPESGYAWGSLGEMFLANDLDEEARICFIEAARLETGNPRWLYFQGVILVNRGDWEGAIPFFQSALMRCEQASEENTVPRLVLAETLHRVGRTDEASRYVQEGIAANPQDVRAHFLAGVIAIGREEWEKAKAHLLNCLGSPFARRKSRIQLAAVCLRLREIEKADELQNEANRMAADADWFDPYVGEYVKLAVKKKSRYKLAESLEASGRFAEAARVLGPMTNEFPDDDLPHLMYGKVLAQMGNFAAAERALGRAVTLAPDKVQSHYYMSLLLVGRGQFQQKQGNEQRDAAKASFREAASHARKALAIKPDYGYAHMALGLAMKQLGDIDGALTALTEAVRCNPEYGELHWHLGEVLIQKSRLADAIPRLEHALRLASPEMGWRREAETRLSELKKKGAESKKGHKPT